MNLPQKDSVTSRAIKTAVQAMVGFLIGLIVVVWAVPGVPHAVISYVQSNLISVLLSVGIPSGVVTYAWNNILRKDLPNY